MVTLALVSMCGMMGLAVDLGWSFFVQKSAQAAADGAALAAVQEAYRLNGGGGNVTCGTAASCTSSAIVSCSTVSATNLFSGCQYAARNGFTPGGESGRQNVTIQADTTVPAPTVPNVTDIRYWVTVRTAQAIPQLFSSVLGNTQGTVSAIATAAIAGSILPGSFYGMNQELDCITALDTNAGIRNCGVDIDLTSTSSNSSQCVNMDGSSSGVNAKLCAPAGIYLSSRCNGSAVVGCGSSASATDEFAGQTSNNPTVWAQGGTKINTGGWVGRGANPSYDASAQNWLPSGSVTNTSSHDFGDPLKTKVQPPILNPSQPTCGVVGGAITGTVGPYQYYALDATGTAATGSRITIASNVVFDPNSTNCPGTVGGTGSLSTGSFRTFTFWGGMDISGNNTNVTFGGGQYVLAGTSITNPRVLNVDGATVTGANGGTAPTMFITTDGRNYSGSTLTMPAPLQAAGYNTDANWKQGFVDLKNGNYTLQGLGAGQSGLEDYKGILFWQDRKNSVLELNTTNGNFISRTRPASTTDTSPQFEIRPGNLTMRMDGLIYQPRGAWFYLNPGGQAAGSNLNLTMVTGALTCGTGCGNASITLRGPSAPTVIYVTALIQ